MIVKEKSNSILWGYIIIFSILCFASFLKGELMCRRKQKSVCKFWLCWEKPIEFISSTGNQAAKWLSVQWNAAVYIKHSALTCTLLNKVSDESRKYVSSQIVTVVTGVILHWETFAILASWFFFSLRKPIHLARHLRNSQTVTKSLFFLKGPTYASKYICL